MYERQPILTFQELCWLFLHGD